MKTRFYRRDAQFAEDFGRKRSVATESYVYTYP